jgi:adenylate cyclase
MKRWYLMLTFVALLAATPIHAKLEGRGWIDSAMKTLRLQKKDKTYVDVLNKVSERYFYIDLDTVALYARQAMELAQSLNYPKGIGASYLNIGLGYEGKGDNKAALACFDSSYKIQESVNDKLGMSISLSELGNVHESLGEQAKALEYYSKALQLSVEVGNLRGQANNIANMALIYQAKGDYSTAAEYFFKALKLHEKTDNKNNQAIVLNNIAGLYMAQGEQKKSKEYYEQALALSDEIGDKYIAAMSNGNLAGYYRSINNYRNAIRHVRLVMDFYHNEGMKENEAWEMENLGLLMNDSHNYTRALELFAQAAYIFKAIGQKSRHASIKAKVGRAYVGSVLHRDSIDVDTSLANTVSRVETPLLKPVLGKTLSLVLAIDNCSRALEETKEVGMAELARDCYECLMHSYALQGHYEEAYENQKKFISIRDSLSSQDQSKKLMEQNMRYDYEKKEAVAKVEQQRREDIATAKLKKQKLLTVLFVAGFAVVLAFAGVFLGQRNKIKQGKKQSDELLLNILPAEVAEELKAKGSAEAKLIDDVTVLFTDFKGFTQLSEKLSPKELVGEINTCFSAFDNIMQKHGVEKIKTIGDAYMAAGGLPTPNKTHAEDVVKAALEIQAFMRRHKEEREAEGKLFFEIRIGVHTGPVVAGIVGIKKFAYDIWGDTVNTASRMESSGTVGKVNISGTTYELVKDKFSCEYRGEVEAKGKGVMRMYFVS